ncbi:hypothetical protein HanRHA438_Chr16g0738041 [Helianthus annuus]|nr:hypothetical protein HanRHA438_Chr16g0738041 [Helianthus annuus]
MNYRTRYQTFTNINERTRPLFTFVHLTKRTKFLVCVRLFNKQTNTNELPTERFTNCLPNVWFVCSPRLNHLKVKSRDMMQQAGVA